MKDSAFHLHREVSKVAHGGHDLHQLSYASCKASASPASQRVRTLEWICETMESNQEKLFIEIYVEMIQSPYHLYYLYTII